MTDAVNDPSFRIHELRVAYLDAAIAELILNCNLVEAGSLEQLPSRVQKVEEATRLVEGAWQLYKQFTTAALNFDAYEEAAKLAQTTEGSTE